MSDYWLGFFDALSAAGAVGGVGGAVALLIRAEITAYRFRRELAGRSVPS